MLVNVGIDQEVMVRFWYNQKAEVYKNETPVAFSAPGVSN